MGNPSEEKNKGNPYLITNTKIDSDGWKIYMKSQITKRKHEKNFITSCERKYDAKSGSVKEKSDEFYRGKTSYNFYETKTK